MPRVALITLEDCYASSLTGLVDIFQVANAHVRKQFGEHVAPFEWRFVSLAGGAVNVSGGLSLATEPLVSLGLAYDLVYIPGIFYNGHEAFERVLASPKLGHWIVEQWQQGALVAANCTGTFLLAEAGLLDKRHATTTWWLEKRFRQRYPKVRLDVRHLLTEDERLLCAGGIPTYQHLALRMIEHFFSPAIASLCAKTLLVDVGQTAQAPFLPLSDARDHGDSLVARAQYKLQQNLRKPLTIKALAAELAVSQRTLNRRFKLALGMQPLTYLQNLRIEAAKQLLELTDLHIETILVDVGYSDASSFSRLFQARTGLTPTAYRERFKRTK
ncbi:helix-turn-helix domain-containing protein [Pseudomonas entomophila]|uniref:GlxA family transcriptional regulator n=1 Tax=Pseudomonas entomophila TaxID=312306 RepID=UPI002404D8C2|nr:helix-turn-helix domain-containing protein [Pseudomonas entomophila]MDF9618448.1 helix-turn-helix domain-containing protein [Pseudomonas entomophila]